MYRCVYNSSNKGPIRWDIIFMAAVNKPRPRATPSIQLGLFTAINPWHLCYNYNIQPLQLGNNLNLEICTIKYSSNMDSLNQSLKGELTTHLYFVEMYTTSHAWYTATLGGDFQLLIGSTSKSQSKSHQSTSLVKTTSTYITVQ